MSSPPFNARWMVSMWLSTPIASAWMRRARAISCVKRAGAPCGAAVRLVNIKAVKMVNIFLIGFSLLLHNDPAFHHPFDALELGDILGRIAVDGDQVGVFARLDSADAVVP